MSVENFSYPASVLSAFQRAEFLDDEWVFEFGNTAHQLAAHLGRRCLMPRYQVSIKIFSTKRISVWADSDEKAAEKATAIVLDWAGVDDAEALDVEEEQ